MSKARKKLPIPIIFFILALSILSVLASMEFVPDIFPQGIESVTIVMIHTASATAEGDGGGESDQGAGDGDQGGDSGSDGIQVAGQDDPQTEPTETTDIPESDPEPTRPADSEICGNSMDDDGDGSVDEDCPTNTLEPSDIGCPPIVEAFGASCKPFEATPLPQEPGLPPGPGDPPPGPTGTEKHESVCEDGVDDDGDGAIDKQDPDCIGKTGFVDPSPPPSQEAKPLTDMTSLAYETVCDDQVDNDRDGRTDQQDSDCHPGLGIPGSSIKPEICGDGKDNDRDGAIDAIDRDCLETKKPPGFDLGMLTTTNPPPSGIQTPPESDPIAEPPISPTEQGLCNDGIDNDRDGLIDTQDTNDCPPLSESRPPGFEPFGP